MKLILILAFVIAPITARGLPQQTTATVIGAVSDTSGAVLVNASISIVNLDTNVRRETLTDESGNYWMPFLPAGTYSVTVSARGFRNSEAPALLLQVAQTLRVDFNLEVSAIAENLIVLTDSSLLQTESPALGAVIDSTRIQQLPLNGRNFIQLAHLIPGAQTGTPGSITVRRGRASVGQSDASFGSTGLSVNGVRDTANRYFLDGVEFMDGDASTYAFAPSIDSLAEFKVETNSYSAESGTVPGAQVHLTTKSGTSRYRATLWEFNRNNALSTTYDAIGQEKLKSPRLNRNQFGFNLGGPAPLPARQPGAAKTFFFFNWERGLQALGTVPNYAIVPTDEQRSGNLSGLVNARTGEPILLKDPLRLGIIDNRIPASALSPQAQAFLGFQPRANTRAGVFNYISSSYSTVSSQSNYSARADHNFSPRDSVIGRHVFNKTLEKGESFWGHDGRDNLARNQNTAVSHTHTFSTRAGNQLLGGWSSITESEIFGTSNDATYDVAGRMGLPLISRRPEDYGPPTILINGPEGSFSTYGLQRQIGPRKRRYTVWQLNDTFAWKKGSHSLRLGAEINWRNYYFSQARNARGLFVFDGTYTGSALSDFLLGYVKQANINATPTRTNMSSSWQAYFAQDEWRPAHNWTVTLGVRYDYFQRWIQDDDKIVNIDQNGVQLAAFVTPADSPYGRSLLAPDRNNFGPRAGFAWRPGFIDNVVVRGGYGIYFQTEHPNASFSMVEGAQATTGGSVIGNTSGVPNVLFANPFEQLVIGSKWSNGTSIDPRLRDAYIQQWNFTIQFQLPKELVVDAGYVGTRGTRLSVAFDEDGMAFNRPAQLVDPRTSGLASINARRPNPLFQRAVEGVKSIGNSNYHALQMRGERRLSSGLTFLTSYTWSKAISGPHDQGGLIGNGRFIGTPQDFYNLEGERSLAGFDQPHRFVQTVIYDLPVFRLGSSLPARLLRGWRLAAIVTAQSGFPAGIDYGVDTTGTGQPSRADAVPGQKPNLPSEQRTWKQWFNTAAFAPAQWGRWGTSSRTGAIRLPGFMNFDFSVSKKLSVSEGRWIELRAEVFNLTNHFNPDPGSVDRSVQSATFGSIGGGVRGVTTRVVQLGAKLQF